MALKAREATAEELELTHAPDHVRMVFDTANYEYKQPEPVSHRYCRLEEGGGD